MLEHVLGIDELLDRLGSWHAPTHAHSVRVAALVRRLALMAGWTDDAAHALHRAGLLHDVGKVRVAVAILDKPGPLDLRETLAMRRHVWQSERMARLALGPEETAWIAAHHERPDGTGYPRGLEAASIPEGAALLALADAWDVMTHARPYSAAREETEALAECTALAGRQFTMPSVQALHALLAYDGFAVEVAA